MKTIEKPTETAEKSAAWNSPGELDKYPESLFRVRFEDCDPFGHLNNGRYLAYALNARSAHLNEVYGLDTYTQRFKERNWVVRSSRVNYIQPAFPEQLIRIRTVILNFSRLGITLEAVITDPETDRLIAVAWMDMVHVELATGRPARHEPDLMEFFERVSLDLSMSHDAEKERVSGIKRELAGAEK